MKIAFRYLPTRVTSEGRLSVDLWDGARWLNLIALARRPELGRGDFQNGSTDYGYVRVKRGDVAFSPEAKVRFHFTDGDGELSDSERRTIRGFILSRPRAGQGPEKQHTVKAKPNLGKLYKSADGPWKVENVYGDDQAYFEALSPWTLAQEHADALRGKLTLRLAVGSRDSMLEADRDFGEHLARLHIPHMLHVVPDVGHHPIALFNALADANWAFYRRELASLELDCPDAITHPAGWCHVLLGPLISCPLCMLEFMHPSFPSCRFRPPSTEH